MGASETQRLSASDEHDTGTHTAWALAIRPGSETRGKFSIHIVTKRGEIREKG